MMNNEPKLVILSNLFNSARITYQVQSFPGIGDIYQCTGLSSGQIYGCKHRLYAYTNTELIELMKLVQSIECNIKKGKISEEISIEYLLVNIFNIKRKDNYYEKI